MLHQVLNLPRIPALRARRAISSARLDASSTAVFTQRMGGLAMLAQSSERPRRTTSALVSAATTWGLPPTRKNNPVTKPPATRRRNHRHRPNPDPRAAADPVRY